MRVRVPFMEDFVNEYKILVSIPAGKVPLN